MRNSCLTVPLKKLDGQTHDALSDAMFEILQGNEKLYLDAANMILTADQVKALIGMEVSADGAAAAMREKAIASAFLIGEITLRGLAINTEYALREIQAPDGYIIAANDITFSLSRENDTLKTNASGTNITVDEDGITILISNQPGVELPETGGIGTDGFGLTGVILAGLAGLALLIQIQKRRRKASV